MKKHLLTFSAVLFISFLFDACKPKEEALNPEVKSELQDNVVQVGSNTDKIVAFNGNTLTVKGLTGFSNSRVAASDIQVGSVIEASPSATLPDGLLVKVINISPSQQYGPGYQNLEIMPAKLEDYRKNCPKSEAKETFIAESVTPEPNVTHKITGTSVELEIQKTFYHSANTEKEKGSVKVSGKIVFERDLKLGLAIENSEIKYFKYEIINKDKLDVSVTGNYTLETEKEFPLATIKGKRIEFLIAGFPVWVKPIFKVGIKLTAKGGIKLDAEIVKFEKEYVRGAEYAGGVWKSLDADKPKDETPLKRDIDLNGEAKVALNAEFEGAFYEGLVSLGMGGEIFGQINSRVALNEPLKADFKAGIDFNVNIESSIFSKKLADFTYKFASWEIRKDIIDLKKDIAIASDLPTTGLVAYYPFNGDAKDASGNNNNGVVNDGVIPTTDRNSNKDKAYSFGGIDKIGYIKIANSANMNLNKTLSTSIWYKLNSYYGMDGWANPNQNGYHVMIGKEGDRDGFYMGVGNDATAKKQNVNFNNNIGFNSIFSIIGNPVGTNLENLNKWIHATTVIDGTNAKLYINGTLVKTMAVTSNFTNSNSRNLYIGTMWALGTTWYPFNGSLDDLRIYNRALSDAEVSALYNAEK